jgi:hypothetical protein
MSAGTAVAAGAGDASSHEPQLKTVQGVRIRICRPTDLYSQIQTNISFLGFAQSFEWR